MNDQDLYLKGISDLVEAIDYYSRMGIEECRKAFDGNKYHVVRAMHEYGPLDFINRINNYKKEQVKPKLGDVVELEYFYATRDKAIFVEYDLRGNLAILINDCSTPLQYINKDLIKSITKTGEHIDIQGMLDKLA